MSSNNVIVREYLASLKEDSELDYLFPILLNLMGFRIVQTAKESKGQSQYGKDIIAIGNDEKGIKHRWYFELKGYADRDITQANYSKPDGIRDSIIEAKDAVFKDSTIPGFNDLPTKIVVAKIAIPDEFMVEEYSELPENWNEYPYSSKTTVFFSKKAKNRDFFAVKVPSTIVPLEYNFVLNPLYKNFGQVEIVEFIDLSIDDRLKKDIR